jgi:hypothetical protein
VHAQLTQLLVAMAAKTKAPTTAPLAPSGENVTWHALSVDEVLK